MGHGRQERPQAVVEAVRGTVTTSVHTRLLRSAKWQQRVLHKLVQQRKIFPGVVTTVPIHTGALVVESTVRQVQTIHGALPKMQKGGAWFVMHVYCATLEVVTTHTRYMPTLGNSTKARSRHTRV